MSTSSSRGATNFFEKLAGHWSGEGEGLWPAVSPLRYREEVSYEVSSRGTLAYQQLTRSFDDRPLHREMGYLRATKNDGVEMLVVQPTGLSEIHVGVISDTGLSLTLVHVIRTPSALRVTNVHRRLTLTSNSLTYLVRIAMNDEPLSDHLRGLLRRSTSD